MIDQKRSNNQNRSNGQALVEYKRKEKTNRRFDKLEQQRKIDKFKENQILRDSEDRTRDGKSDAIS